MASTACTDRQSAKARRGTVTRPIRKGLVLWGAPVVLLSAIFQSGCAQTRFVGPARQTSDEPGDVFRASPRRPAHLQSPPLARSAAEREKWLSELQRLKQRGPAHSIAAILLEARCYDGTEQYEEAGKAYARAAEKSQEANQKRSLQRAAIDSYTKAGLVHEQAGRYGKAARVYEICNEYCRRFNHGIHIPHDIIEHLRLKASKEERR